MSVSATIDRWENIGIAGLFDAQKPGRPPIIRKEDQKKIAEQIK
jgi:transposase